MRQFKGLITVNIPRKDEYADGDKYEADQGDPGS